MKKILVAVIAVLAFMPLAAKEIPMEQARLIAEKFFSSKPVSRAAAVRLDMVWDGRGAIMNSSLEAPAFYVFDNTAGPGFVIVSGDDAVAPVIGYSHTGEFKYDDMPSNIRGYLEGIKTQIEYARSVGMEAYPLTSSDVGEDVVKYQTALWDQSAPYNNQCPKYEGERTLTGCVATAIAIVMKYHRWPDAGVGVIPAYQTNLNDISVDSRTLGEPYDWDNMPDDYSSGYTYEQGKEIARLMADCGAMLMAEYGVEFTGAFSENIPSALATYMKYDKSVTCFSRGAYSNEEWNNMIQKELEENGPVLYSGADLDFNGHQFVLDGYTTNDYYSVNWGWAGYNNGYFLLSVLNYGGGDDGFSEYQTAVLNVKKDEGNPPLSYWEYMPYEDVESGYFYNGITTDATEFVPGSAFRVYAGWIMNKNSMPYTGELLYAMTDKEGTIKEVLAGAYVEDLYSTWGFYDYRDVTITEMIEPGDRIVVMYLDSVTGEYKAVRGNTEYGTQGEILLMQEEIPPVPVSYIEENTAYVYYKNSKVLYFTTLSEVVAKVTDSDGKDVPFESEINSDNYASWQDIAIPTESLEPGRYLVSLSVGETVKELYFVVGSSTL